MVKPSLFMKAKDYIAGRYGDDIGKMLVHTGVIGWILSSAAQVAAIVINDKIPKEQKMFLIPQEIADAGVNIASFYLITNCFKSFASKLVKAGKWAPKSVREFLNASSKLKEKVGKVGFDILKDVKNIPEKIAKDYKFFEDGVDVVATTVGSVLSCNIVTPLLRNRFASDRQKTGIARMNANSKKDQNSDVKTIQRPTMETFKTLSYANPSGSLKI